MLLLLSYSCNSKSISTQKENYVSVKCFTKGESAIKLYKTPTDSLARDTLVSLAGEEYCWYIIEFEDTKNGRYKIKNIEVKPSCRAVKLPKYNGLWIDKSNDLFIESVYHSFKNDDVLSLYLNPDKNSEKMLTNEYHRFNFLDFKNSWVKVSYLEDGILKVGWMTPEDQCCAPWTECPQVN
ncbi:hypothetical protein [Flavobacterium subsaxonicum]|nr:hypothetical protein [Flavobacterium subsaxonicum]